MNLLENPLSRQKPTTNTTLLKLRGTPFKTAADMKVHEDRILMEEWERIERAKSRRQLFKKDENAEVLAPFQKGWGARFVGGEDIGNLVKVYLTKDDEIQIDIDDSLRSKDAGNTVEVLVKSISSSFIGGYLATLGLTDLRDDNVPGTTLRKE